MRVISLDIEKALLVIKPTRLSVYFSKYIIPQQVDCVNGELLCTRVSSFQKNSE